MAINFEAMSSVDASAPVAPASMATEVTNEAGDVVIDLSKGISVDLSKVAPGLKKVRAALSWDTATIGAPADLDVSALCLGDNGKISSAADVIYFNHRDVPGIHLSEDNTTGDGDGDDETIEFELDAISSECKEIAIVVNIYDAVARKQTFGMIDNSRIRLIDMDTNKEICRFSLKDDYASSTGIIVAKLSRKSGSWTFVTIGEGKVANDLNAILQMFS